ARRALLAPALLCVVAAALLLVPARTVARGAARAGVTPADVVTRALPPASPLRRLRAVVRPPAYTGLRARELDDPSSIASVVASVVELAGEGDGAVTARLGERVLPVARGEARWRVTVRMPGEPAVVRLGAADAERLVILEPRPDSVPVVTLAPSVTDTVLREPKGRLALAAHASDDFGLASAAWEWIVSSGEGESFTFRSGTVGATALSGRRAELRATLALDALALKPGDVVHLRAVARDRNDVSGPGMGASETRTIRIARAGEYDSLAVEGAPPPDVEKGLLSQRMLLLLTERLEERRPRLSRDTVVAEARRIGRDQTTLRRRVGELIFERLGEGADGEHSHFAGDGHEHGAEGRLDPEQLLEAASRATGGDAPTVLDFEGDETPVVKVNRPLLEAYNHMWDATRALDVGDPRGAIPPMRRALEALQRARQAERIYLRGRPPVVVVDVAKARLQGRDSASAPAARTPRTPEDPAAAARAARLDAALVVLQRDAAAAVDSLMLLRVDALGAAPSLAAALGELVERVRRGEDATPAILRARRAAAGEPRVMPALPRWSGGAW
ncbi:MAG TPA: DUF4175 family protein, partial [Gemmatimonadaceae bacterium]|nr:DUF4175 family protein [Gemmatimonadaceae bacterium]